MNSRFNLIFFVHFTLLCGVLNAQTYTGAEANKQIAGAEIIRIGEFSVIPEFVKFHEGQELDYSKFDDFLHRTFSLSDKISLQLINSERDHLGMIHYRYVQTFENRKVEGTMYIVHTKSEKVLSFNGLIFDQIKVHKQPVISEKIALSKALNYVNAERYLWESVNTENHLIEEMNNLDATWYPKGELVIVAEKGVFKKDKLKLAYKFDIYAVKPLRRNYIFVDAVNGQIVHEQNRIMDVNIPATAFTAYSGQRNIITDSLNGVYRLRETSRGLGIETYNLLGGYNVNDAVDFTNTTTSWDSLSPLFNHYARDAHWGAEISWDFYDSLFNRNSIDNAGHKLLGYVYYASSSNAFWDGTHMLYGGGNPSIYETPYTSLEIVGHEVSHGLTQFSSNLVYQDESGALNESFSDCMGVAIRQFGKNTLFIDWLLGDEIGHIFRDMSNPNQYNHPDTYLGSNWSIGDVLDYGGVHTNSGVANFWFYLLTMGGTGTNDNGDAYSISALGLEKATRILYRANTLYNIPYTQFAGARVNTIQAAVDLYGPCSSEVIMTTNAWNAVGVGGAYSSNVMAAFIADNTSFCTANDTVHFINLSNNALLYTWYFGDGTTSNLTNPFHIYNSFGTYDVKLIADGGTCGIDSILQTTFITVDAGMPCAINIGTNSVQTACTGTFYDSGGPNINYFNNTNYTITIAPSGAYQVMLDFILFDMGYNYNCVKVYDGPSISSPLIGTFSGVNYSFNLPSSVISSGSSLTIQQIGYYSGSGPGFQINWSCILQTTPPVVDFEVDFNNSCTGIINFLDNSTIAPHSWLWRFGDGTVSTDQNPTHVYTVSGTYQVTLIATNLIGTDSLVQSNYITINLPAAPIPVVSQVNINCGDSAVLMATSVAQIQWFDNPFGGILLDTTNIFTTPILDSNATFYVQTFSPQPTNFMDPPNNTMGTGVIWTGNGFIAQVFDVISQVRLVSVKVYANGSGPRTIELRNSLGNTLQSITLNIPDGESRQTLNFDIPVGVGYKLGIGSAPNLYQNYDGANYPYDYPGVLSITGNSILSPSRYFYFYEWEIQEPPCLSARIPIDVIVNEPMAMFTTNTIGLTSSFSNSSVSASSFLWEFGDGNTSVDVNPIHNYNLEGTYTTTLYAFSGNCVDSMSQTQIIISTGLLLEKNNLSLEIYPNPGNGIFNLNLIVQQKANLKFTVFNALGQLIYESQLLIGNEQSEVIDLSNNSKGVYFVKLNNENYNLVKKLIIK
jgi:Zn-dependent metalloprotease